MLLPKKSRSTRASFVGVIVAFLALAGPATHAVAQSAGDYPLAPGDIVDFDFLDDTELARQLTIANDGRIQIPLLGSVKIAGLTSNEALALVRNKLIEANLLVDPNISLAVAVFRPIFILGDVKSPGSFPFQPQLTAEQAVALAGGPITLTTEDRALTRAKLQGLIAATEADLTNEAVLSAQAAARLKNLDRVVDEDLPETTRPYLVPSLLKALLEGAAKILENDRTAFETQRAILTEASVEAGQQLEILDKLATNQQVAIQSTKEQIERSKSLLNKGLTVANETASLERQLSSDEGRLLTIYSQVAEARRAISSLKLELSQLEEKRKGEALLQLQERRIAIEKLFADRKAAEEQLFLVTNLMSEDPATRLSMDYKIRRRLGDAFLDMRASDITNLFPGDVLVVSIKKLGMGPTSQ